MSSHRQFRENRFDDQLKNRFDRFGGNRFDQFRENRFDQFLENGFDQFQENGLPGQLENRFEEDSGRNEENVDRRVRPFRRQPSSSLPFPPISWQTGYPVRPKNKVKIAFFGPIKSFRNQYY